MVWYITDTCSMCAWSLRVMYVCMYVCMYTRMDYVHEYITDTCSMCAWSLRVMYVCVCIYTRTDYVHVNCNLLYKYTSILVCVYKRMHNTQIRIVHKHS
jgi:hypothetical protein